MKIAVSHTTHVVQMVRHSASSAATSAQVGVFGPSAAVREFGAFDWHSRYQLTLSTASVAGRTKNRPRSRGWSPGQGLPPGQGGQAGSRSLRATGRRAAGRRRAPPSTSRSTQAGSDQSGAHPGRGARRSRTVLVELAGASPAAPDGPGLPGCLPWSGEACRSWCRVAAGGLVGWRVSWVRAWPPGFSGVAPGLAVPRPPGRCGSLSRVSWPGGRARVARSPALPRGARSPSGWCSRSGASQCSAPHREV